MIRGEPRDLFVFVEEQVGNGERIYIVESDEPREQKTQTVQTIQTAERTLSFKLCLHSAILICD